MKNFTKEDAEKALIRLANVKGRDRAKLVEQMFRFETSHFTSLQYQRCGSPGMEMGDWTDLDESKMEKMDMLDNHPDKVKKKMRTFLVWNNVYDFCLYLSNYIDRYNGNWGRWNSRDPQQQERYESAVAGVIPRFVK